MGKQVLEKVKYNLNLRPVIFVRRDVYLQRNQVVVERDETIYNIHQDIISGKIDGKLNNKITLVPSDEPEFFHVPLPRIHP